MKSMSYHYYTLIYLDKVPYLGCYNYNILAIVPIWMSSVVFSEILNQIFV